MNKLLSLLGTITLIASSTTSLVACNTPSPHEYTPKELVKLKEKNKINTDNKQIKKNLEWIAPQEKPFKEQDNKWYIVVWRSDKKDDWRIVKFNNSKYDVIEIDQFNHDKLITDWKYLTRTLCIKWSSILSSITDPEFFWENDDGTYFKAVYRWNNDKNIPNLYVDHKTAEIKVES